jgi:hypothetical protein
MHGRHLQSLQGALDFLGTRVVSMAPLQELNPFFPPSSLRQGLAQQGYRACVLRLVIENLPIAVHSEVELPALSMDAGKTHERRGVMAEFQGLAKKISSFL